MKTLAFVLVAGFVASPSFAQQSLSKLGPAIGDAVRLQGQTGSDAGLGTDEEDTGTVRGKVTDRRGNALSGVEVKIVEPGNEDESVAKATTDLEGLFEIKSVPAAVYDVKAGKGGHVGLTLSGVVILPDKELMLRVVMNELVLE